MAEDQGSMELVNTILQAGYLTLLEETIEATVGQLLSAGQSKETAKQAEILRLTIEQAYINLEELVHFLSADDGQLEELTKSQLVRKTFMLISEPKF